MKYLLALFSLFIFSQPAVAVEQVRIKAKIFYKGKYISSPTITTLDTETATIRQSSSSVDQKNLDYFSIQFLPVILKNKGPKTVHTVTSIDYNYAGEKFKQSVAILLTENQETVINFDKESALSFVVLSADVL